MSKLEKGEEESSSGHPGLPAPDNTHVEPKGQIKTIIAACPHFQKNLSLARQAQEYNHPSIAMQRSVLREKCINGISANGNCKIPLCGRKKLPDGVESVQQLAGMCTCLTAEILNKK